MNIVVFKKGNNGRKIAYHKDNRIILASKNELDQIKIGVPYWVDLKLANNEKSYVAKNVKPYHMDADLSNGELIFSIFPPHKHYVAINEYILEKVTVSNIYGKSDLNRLLDKYNVEETARSRIVEYLNMETIKELKSVSVNIFLCHGIPYIHKVFYGMMEDMYTRKEAEQFILEYADNIDYYLPQCFYHLDYNMVEVLSIGNDYILVPNFDRRRNLVLTKIPK